MRKFTIWLAITPSKFYDWQERYGCANKHNGNVPREHWLESWEREAIITFHENNPLEGYRRITFMMMDQDIVAVSPATTWRVLTLAGVLDHWVRKPSKKGTGFNQPLGVHKHWHVDISYLNISGTFYYLCSVLDGYSRLIVHWEIGESMKEEQVEIIIQKANELHPGYTPRIISDNGPQFVAKDFKEFIRLSGMTHVRTSPYYPQSNGKIERWHKSIKSECLRVKTPLSLADAREIVSDYVEYYNNVRLHSAIGYVTPRDKAEGRDSEIILDRKHKLELARSRRKINCRENKLGITQSDVESAVDSVVRSPCLNETEASSAGTQLAEGLFK